MPTTICGEEDDKSLAQRNDPFRLESETIGETTETRGWGEKKGRRLTAERRERGGAKKRRIQNCTKIMELGNLEILRYSLQFFEHV